MGRKLRKPLSFPLEKIWSLKKIPLERGPSSSSGCSKKSAHKQYETEPCFVARFFCRDKISHVKKTNIRSVSSPLDNVMQIHVSSRELLILIYSWVNFLMSTWMYHDFNIRHFRMRTLDLNPKTKINYKVTFQIPWYPLTQSIKRIVIMKLKARGRYFHTCLYKDGEQYCARTNFYSLIIWDSSFSCKCRRYCWNSWK